jgi:(p)ppGpp synthase/HD superfamily hydrolase
MKMAGGIFGTKHGLIESGHTPMKKKQGLNYKGMLTHVWGDNMGLLSKAIELATSSHAGQKDKQGQPYILHPLRVMLSVESLDEKVVAVLHEVLEDTDCTADTLRSQGIPEHLVAAVIVLTRNNNKTYEEYLADIKANSLARKVKLADIQDNMSTVRLLGLSPDQAVRMAAKYTKAYQFLTDANWNTHIARIT